jgi:hypothetical protein
MKCEREFRRDSPPLCGHKSNRLYMNDADFDSVMIIAGERPDIRTIMSSTPTGRRAKFYEACTNPDLGL